MSRLLARLSGVPLYPILLLAAFLITEMIGQWVPVGGLIRPLVVLGLATIVVQLCVVKAVGVHSGSFVAAVIVFVAFELQTAAFLIVAAGVPLVLLSLRRRRLVAFDWRQVTAAMNVLAAISLTLTIRSVLQLGAAVPAGSPRAQAAGAGVDLPDVYLILLDAYPRSDTLSSTLGFDNAAFLDAMSSLGFDSAEDAHSNYNRTTLTVPSLLNAEYLSTLMPSPPPTITEQHRAISSLVNSGRAIDAARSVGYKFIAIPSEVEFLSPNTADQFLDSGDLSKFETLLARNGLLGRIFESQRLAWFRESHQRRVSFAFSELQALAAERSSSPRLVYAHVMAPHNPIVFRKDGSLANVRECYWDGCDLTDPMSDSLKVALVEQIEYVNDQVLSTVREIKARSARPPVIVVFSDHGFRHWLTDGPETFRSLQLAFTPGRDGIFPEDAVPVNMIPRLLNSYAGTSLPLQERNVWNTIPEGGDQTGYFPMTVWDHEPPP